MAFARLYAGRPGQSPFMMDIYDTPLKRQTILEQAPLLVASGIQKGLIRRSGLDPLRSSEAQRIEQLEAWRRRRNGGDA